MIFETWFQTTWPVSTEAGLGARSHGPGAHALSIPCTSLPQPPASYQAHSGRSENICWINVTRVGLSPKAKQAVHVAIARKTKAGNSILIFFSYGNTSRCWSVARAWKVPTGDIRTPWQAPPSVNFSFQWLMPLCNLMGQEEHEPRLLREVSFPVESLVS